MDFLFRDICDSSRLQNESEDLKVLTEQYDEILCSVLNNYAPLKQRVVTIRTSAPWNNQEVASEKIKRRRLERKWRKTASDIILSRTWSIDHNSVL